jgi:hypothetical protein
MRDQRLVPATLYREVARSVVGRQTLSGRGVLPRVDREIEQWLSANRERFPGLELHPGEGAPTIRIGAIDLKMFIGYATAFLDHMREQVWDGHDGWTHARPNATVREVLGFDSEKKLGCSDKAWPQLRASLARRIVARELGISVQTIRRRLSEDPHFKGPSIWGWAAQYHLHSLNPVALR